MDKIYKEVYFEQYCKSCKHSSNKEDEDPCNDCLNEPANVYSHSWKNNTWSPAEEKTFL